MAKFQPAEAFDFSNPNGWPEWKQRFTWYRAASKLLKEDEEVQVSALIYSMHQQAETAMKSFVFAAKSDANKYATMLQKFVEYFAHQKNIIHEEAMFYQRNQHSGENIETSAWNLYEIVERSDFGATKEEQIHDHLMIGIKDKELSQELQLQPKVTLSKAVQAACQMEPVKSNLA